MARFLKLASATVLPSKSDEEILAFVEDLHRRYARYVYTLCFRMMRDRSEAEDVLQETFIRVFRFHDNFTQGDDHLPWLYRIATNMCLNALKKRSLSKAVLRDDIDTWDRSTNSDNEGLLKALQRKEIVNRILTDEDERGQQILVMHFVAGMTQSEVAEALDISTRAVVKRLAKFRKKMGGTIESMEKDHV